MGWWRIGDGDDMIGDDPADALQTAFTHIVKSIRPGDQAVMALPDFLGAVLAALNLNPAVLLKAGEVPQNVRLVAIPAGEHPPIYSSSHSQIDEKIVRQLFDAFAEIAVQYEDSELGRKPRLSELLATIGFVLSYRSAGYSRITEQLALKAIRAEVAGDF